MRKILILLTMAILWGCCSVEETPSNVKNEENGTSADFAIYTVMHYKQALNEEGYTVVEYDTTTLTGTVGSKTSATAKDYKGFTAREFEQQIITSDGKMVIKIYYDRKLITLTLNCDNGTAAKTITGKFGADVKVDVPTKTGYTFAAWNPELPATFPAEDAQYTAKWVKEGDYTITYELNGGTNVADNPAGYNAETETITLKEATKTGYTFGGWYKEDSFATKVTEIAKGSTGNIKLYAKWTVNTSTSYKVEHYQQNVEDNEYALFETEDKNGSTDTETAAAAKSYAGFIAREFKQEKISGDGSTTVKIYYDRKMVILTLNYDNGTAAKTITGKFGADVKVDVPTKTGYTFAAWNPELPATFPAEDTQYTAKWVKEGDYIITYKNTENAVNDNPAGYNVETETITLKPAIKAGYIFDGWYKEDSFATKVNEITKGSTGNITLYAKWSLETYKIAYELNGGTNAAENPAGYNAETETTTLKPAVKSGYIFDGWYEEDSFATKVTEIAKGSTGNITLYAKWNLETYTITYELNGGTNVADNPAGYNAENETITLKEATKTGYTFGGWYKEDSFATKVTEIAKGSTGNVTLYAKWKLETYSITYELNGGTNADENPVGYNVENETITLKPAVKSGYIFDGWYKENSFTTKVTEIAKGSTGNITLYAKWNLETYTITYELNGGTNTNENPENYNVETETITLKEATKAGYVFDGWYKEA